MAFDRRCSFSTHFANWVRCDGGLKHKQRIDGLTKNLAGCNKQELLQLLLWVLCCKPQSQLHRRIIFTESGPNWYVVNCMYTDGLS